MLVLLLTACLPPILEDTGIVPDSGADSGLDGDTSDTGGPIDADGDGVAEEDCNDADPAVYPDAPEALDLVDQDCDGSLSEDVGSFAGAQSLRQTGFITALEPFPRAAGDDRVAVAITATNTVAVVHANELDDGDTDLEAITNVVASAGTGFGIDLLAGDLDDDGLADLLVGDPTQDGAGYVIVDGASLSPSAVLDAELLPSFSDSGFLGSVGFASAQVDSVVAMASAESAATAVALVLGEDLISGAVSSTSQAGLIDTRSEAAWTGFGATLDGGDLDGDGVSDLIVGAPLAALGAGAVAVFSGSDLSTNSGDVVLVDEAWAVFEGASRGDRLGGGTVLLDDVSGDGLLDVAFTEHSSASGSRSWYIVLGGARSGTSSVSDAALTVVSSFAAYEEVEDLNFVSATAANIDGADGNELLIASPGDTTGHAYLFRGSTLASGGVLGVGDAAVSITGEAGDGLGQVALFGGPLADSPDEFRLFLTAPNADQGTFWSIPLAP